MAKPRMLITIPVEPNGFISAELTLWLLKIRERGAPADWPDITCQIMQGKPVASTRNGQCRRAIEEGFDYVLFVDNDCIPDTEGFQHLWDAIQRNDVEAVGGWSVMWTPDMPSPCLQKYDVKRAGGAEPHYDLLSRPAGLYQITDGGIGAHCLMVKVALLKGFAHVKRVWFKDQLRDGALERWELDALVATYGNKPEALLRELKNWLEDPREDFTMEHLGQRWTGQDVWFCMQCHALNMRLWVDTRVLWGHIKNSDLRHEFIERMVLQQRITALESEVKALKEPEREFAVLTQQEAT